MWRNGVMSFASIAVLMSLLVVIGGFSLLVYNIDVNLDNFGVLNQIVVFVDRDADEDEIVAVGEIGLDYHWSPDTAELQKKALKEQFRIASELDLPVNIHLRDATEDFFNVLEECRHLNLRGNLHAFSGSYETFCRIQKYGDWSVGIGGVLTFKKSNLPTTLPAVVPIDRIVLETDSPYMAPVPHRGQRNESAFVANVCTKLAESYGLSPEEVDRITTTTAKRIFNL